MGCQSFKNFCKFDHTLSFKEKELLCFLCDTRDNLESWRSKNCQSASFLLLTPGRRHVISFVTAVNWYPNRLGVVEVGAELTGGRKTLCIRIGYSSREPRRVFLPCNKIGYVSARY